MHKLPVLLTAAILSLAVAPALAAPPKNPAPPAPPAPAPAPAALSPAIQSALNDFSSDNFKTRQDASAKLQLALASQLRALTTSDDPEVVSRLADLLDFNEGLSRWISNSLKLPPDQRKTQLDFGLQPDVLPALALTFSTDPAKRVEGIKALAKIDQPQSADLLASFLNDPERTVYVAAMDALWDKKPTDAVVNALWDRAIGDAPQKPQTAPEPTITFRGRQVGGGAVFIGNFFARRRDADLALDTLINIKAPQVNKKILAFLDNYDKAANNANPNVAVAHNNLVVAGNGPRGVVMLNGGGNTLYNLMGEPMKFVLKLVEAYKPKDAFPILYKLATAPARSKSQGALNKDTWFFSNRTAPLAALVLASEQDPDDYKLQHVAIFNNAWTFHSPEDEAAALKKLHDWYLANVDKNTPDLKEEAPDNAPAPAPPALAPPPMLHQRGAPAQPNGPIIGKRIISRTVGPIVEPGDNPDTQP